MGCLSSRPEPDPQINSSKHGNSKHGRSLHGRPDPSLPDFGVGNHMKVLRLLGEGGSGQTWLCRDNQTMEEMAVKYMPRPIPKLILPMILHEVKIQAALGEGHVNLVCARELMLTRSHLALGMEYVSGGNLTDYVSDKWETTHLRNGLFLSEGEALYLFKQFLSAVEYLHANHVAHRDLKLDNIVLSKSDPPMIKLCDFGFAKDWAEQSNMFTQIGTPVYMSPQVINSRVEDGGYDAQKADVWACGVLLFVMLLGMFPFEHSEHPDPNSSQAHAEVWLQQIKCNWRESPRIADAAKKLSPECQDLLDKIFELDERKRIDIQGIRAHPWFNGPLQPKHQTTLDELTKIQTEKNKKLRAGVYQNEARFDSLNKLVDQAGARGAVDQEVVRVPLARPKDAEVDEKPLQVSSMNIIKEDE